jgi:hypothetical protein
MLTTDAIHEVGDRTVLVAGTAYLVPMVRSLRAYRGDSPTLVFAFRRRVTFTVGSDSETERHSYLAWLSIGVVLEDTATASVVRTLRTECDVPLVGHAVLTPDHAAIIITNGLKLSTSTILNASMFEAIRRAWNAQCLMPGCMRPRDDGETRCQPCARSNVAVRHHGEIRPIAQRDICEVCGEDIVVRAHEDDGVPICRSCSHALQHHPWDWRTAREQENLFGHEPQEP